MPKTFTQIIPTGSLVALLTALLLGNAYAHDQYLIEHMKLEKDLPFSMVNDIHMASDGYLWICNYDGLIRYDGESFKRFDQNDSPSLRSGSLAIVEDADGTLWIACNSRAIDQYQDGIFKHWNTTDGLDFPNYHRLYLDHLGRMMLIGKTGLQSIKNGTVVNFPIPGFERLSIQTLQFTSDGTCYLICEDSNIYKTRFVDEQFTDIESVPIPKNLDFQASCVTAGPENSLWIGSYEGGFYELNQHGDFQAYPPSKTGISSAVLGLAFDSKKTLWVILRNGMLLSKQETYDFFPLPIGTNAAIYGEVVFSHDGAIIGAARDSGLFQFRVPKTGFLTQQQGLGGRFVHAICKNDDGTLLIATENGIQTYKDGSFEAYRDDIFGQKSVRDVFVDSQDRLWVCLLTQKLICIDRARNTIWDSGGKIETSRFRTTAEDQNGTIWVGSVKGLYSFKGKGLPTSFDSHLLKDLAVLSLFVDRENRLWVGTANDGLYRIENDTIVTKITDTEDSATFFAPHQDEQGRMIYGSTDGILVIEPTDERRYFSFGDNQDTIFGCIDDHQGNYWFTCAHSIKRVNKKDFYARLSGQQSQLKYELFDSTNALPAKDPKANARTIIDDEGKIWFPLKGGISIVDPSHIVHPKSPPLVYIQSIEMDDTKSIELLPKQAKPIEVGPQIKTLRIAYVGINYQTNERLHYKVRLKGFEDWRETRRIEAFYSNLPPKKYQFEVLVKDGEGVWSKEPVSLPIHIRPHFYEMLWFQIASAVVVVALLLMLFQHRVRYLNQKRQLLEQMVGERTQQLENVSRDLYISASALTEANENKKRMLSMAAHDLKNAASGIVSSSELLEDAYKQKLDQDACKELVSMISVSGHQILSTIKELLEKEEHEFERKNLNLEKRSLLQLIDSVVALNKTNAQAKLQRIEVRSNIEGECRFDPLKIRMAIDNYLSNAIKYSSNQTEIVIQLEELSHQGHDCFKLTVKDEGPGLTEEDIQNSFRRYTRLSATPTAGEHSSGIGLSIVKEIIEAHEGWVGVDSKFGAGSSFYFLLPKDL